MSRSSRPRRPGRMDPLSNDRPHIAPEAISARDWDWKVMTVTHIIRDGELYSIEDAPAPKANGQAVYVISDTQEMLWHPVTGKRTDSKSEFRKMTVTAGCRELGNDVNMSGRRHGPPKLSKQERARAVKTAIDQLRSGYRGPHGGMRG